MYVLCRHIKPDGQACGSPAIRGTLFCFHHTRIHTVVAQSKPAPNFCGTKPLPFVFPEDRAAIQHNYFVILQAVNNKRIDLKTANVFKGVMRACEINLSKGPLVDAKAENTAQRVILTPEGDEIAPPRELLEKGEDTPTHHKGCPCRRCAEEFRGALPEQHHADCKCGMCEEDLPSRQPRSEYEAGSACATGEEGASDENIEPSVSSASSVVNKTEPFAFSALPVVNKKEPTRSAPSRKLYDTPTIDPINRSYDVYNYLYGDALRKHEAQYAARARAAIEAGLEPPPYEVFDKTKVKRESESSRRHEAYLAEVEKNKKIGEEIWNRRFPHLKYEEPAPDALFSS